MRGGKALLLLAAACASSSPTPSRADFRVIAHRGASAHAPENTLPAFEAALLQGAREVELDVQLSRDGVPVLFHDGTLDEKTGLSGAVRDHDAATLLRADIGRWFDATHPDARRSWAGTPLLRLDALFERFGAAFHYHVEMKSQEPELPAAIFAAAARHGVGARLTLTSFHGALLRQARDSGAGVGLAWLVRTPAGAEGADAGAAARRTLVERAAQEGFTAIAFPAQELDAELVQHAHRRGLGIRAWKVTSEALLLRARNAGADGATVDWPARALRLLARQP